jgi:hypothetical protein
VDVIRKALIIAALILAVLALFGAEVLGLSSVKELALGLGCLAVASLL